MRPDYTGDWFGGKPIVVAILIVVISWAVILLAFALL